MKPLNIWSRSDEEIGRLMSNSANTPFTLHGVEYASIEAFYASILLHQNEAKREKVRKLWGVRAKHEIPKVKPVWIEYQGTEFATGSTTHHELVKQAIRAKLAAHPKIAEAFVATSPRPLVHETDYPDPPGAEFPHYVLCRILTELRDEFAAASKANSLSGRRGWRSIESFAARPGRALAGAGNLELVSIYNSITLARRRFVGKRCTDPPVCSVDRHAERIELGKSKGSATGTNLPQHRYSFSIGLGCTTLPSTNQCGIKP